MAYNNRMVDAMVNTQFDAFKNMYDIELQWPAATTSISNTQEIVSIRAKGIKIPDFEIATYERHYHGSKINIPKPEQTFDRQVEITFTMDSAFQYYQVFCQWASMCGDPVNGGVSNSIPTSLYGQLVVAPLTGSYFANQSPSSDSKTVTQPSYVKSGNGGDKEAGVINEAKIYWAFGNCWVSKVTAPEFAVDSSEPLEFTVTFQFLDFDAPGYGGFRTKQASDGYAPTKIGGTNNKGTGTLSSGTGGTGTGTGEGGTGTGEGGGGE